jgi:hypothetical protein
MFSRIRKHSTYTNLALTLALLFMMSGGAYAASKYLITSTKQISPKVLAALKGKAGPAGVPGAAGAAGLAGATGAQGPKGENGSAGGQGTKGETGPAGPAGPQGPKGSNGANGNEGPEGPQGPTGVTGPQGPEGSPWTAGGTLPSGRTETGAWSVKVTGQKESGVSTSISFTLPLKTAPTTTNYVTETEEEEHKVPVGCEGGTIEKPTAKPGNLCVYQAIDFGPEAPPGFFNPGSHTIGGGASTTGTVMEFNCPEEICTALGNWAVTAE